ncbi:tRNA uridine-5-carboxymethylaminomethyl(34) synthesis GTPase MnmE [Eisenbergiella tayi]|uniref:tRNA uridine-5-carboxymethylaminomethyl(34) synthesis GTPase MnmE n=1 Tax=Eisenbergiella tayi TaxID=1432052 RepID=UPI0008496C25|nr:tRNA uridine-5-carboxymethylaminomethyl(34) synthesis GTPase MnmE [Eisenbergiella tayi]ODR34477.1 tRNA uridine-5-carboxymethylaminomethyl(34) synthesis GTPase MnmE [Eisenbergiella tayi]
MKQTETIAAIATALSDSGIGIVRISGDDAIEIGSRVYRSKNGCHSLKDYGSHTIHYGFIMDGEEILDEVMAAVMKAPNSYTKEDTVEINCHGGVLIVQKVLETVLRNGARLAEPGEFTKRAFLNGRIDLAKAEAVMDIIHSRNEFALKSSMKQLKGSISDCIRQMREEILYEIAFIESALDDPEHISTEGYPEKLLPKIGDLLLRCNKLIDSADDGKVLKEGINTVIVGKPNAGKSSLMNLLVGEEKAIVTDVAGTTRDVLEESIRLHGIGLNIIDTAGIRSTEDVVEKIGVERALKIASDADLILYVVDSSVALDESDEEILDLIRGKKCIVLLNKTDLVPVVEEEEIRKKLRDAEISVIRTSTRDNTGIEEFENTIKEMFFSGALSMNEEVIITNMRHKQALEEARDSLLMVKKSLEDEMPEDFYSIDLMSAYASLGYIIGEEVGEDLVNEIFSKFCMGK